MDPAALVHKGEDSHALDATARIGLVTFGIVHLVVAWLALRLAFGAAANPSPQGALQGLARQPAGRALLYVVAVGLFALVGWQLLEAFGGHRDRDGRARTVARLGSAVKVFVYGALAISALRVALGVGTSGNAQSLTARLMSLPLGQVLVALVGVTVAGVGVGLVATGWTDRFMSQFDFEGRTGDDGLVFRWLGKAGYLSKGIALGIVGALFCYAAATQDPQRSGGLDQALHEVLRQPFGPVLLVVMAVGIGCFGLFCFAWAWHLDR